MKILKLPLILLFLILVACGKEENNNPVNPGGGSNSPPNAPSNPNPANNALNVNRFLTLQWTCSDPNPSDTLRYDVLIGNANPPATIIASNILNSIYDVGLVAGNATIYWKIIAKDNKGGYTEGPVWSFTTAN